MSCTVQPVVRFVTSFNDGGLHLKFAKLHLKVQYYKHDDVSTKKSGD